jgi:DNA-binding MarR family transcriptional regulator
MEKPEKPFSHDDCNCFAVRQAARYITQLYERHLVPVSLTSAQFSVLSKLARRAEGWTMADLADSMVMDRTTLLRALKPLQRDGLVVSSVAEERTRTHVLQLSEAGRARYQIARGLWQQAQAEFEKVYGTSRAKALRTELFAVTRP